MLLPLNETIFLKNSFNLQNIIIPMFFSPFYFLRPRQKNNIKIEDISRGFIIDGWDHIKTTNYEIKIKIKRLQECKKLICMQFVYPIDQNEFC
ncbi:hypothetical protein PFAG_03978 [Plasmodium falciparum Santa Lucia]|uniref:Uncharacterized protein n=1 Tax=Plasmodium falciparum Santa Lucia TaxID=478859 RepID=W7FVH9_PLAFA|nr:hypothetical protein PFAG_03978 [Plasmodium falciparum Santa Lucia]